MKLKIPILTLLLVLSTNHNITLAQTTNETEIHDIFFPTEKSVTFIDSFGDGRYGHSHEGTDLMGEQMMPLYSAIDGRIKDIINPEASWGYAITLKDDDGYTYHYLHINNDTPGTDDGNGGTENAYAPGLTEGMKVSKGDLLGWMGDSGNAEEVAHHLHFEIRKPDKTAINAYPSLLAALEMKIDYNINEALKSSPDINTDKNIQKNNNTACKTNSLIKLANSQAVYYCGADGKRYVFPNDKIYFSWYDDFNSVETISLEDMANIPLGGNVTYRPGVKMVKLQTDSKVFAIGKGGVLRWIRSAETAEVLYGEDWNKQINDIPDSFFMNYVVGEAI